METLAARHVAFEEVVNVDDVAGGGERTEGDAAVLAVEREEENVELAHVGDDDWRQPRYLAVRRHENAATGHRQVVRIRARCGHCGEGKHREYIFLKLF